MVKLSLDSIAKNRIPNEQEKNTAYQQLESFNEKNQRLKDECARKGVTYHEVIAIG